MVWIAVGGLGLLLALALLRAFATAPLGQVKSALAWGAGLLGVVLVGVLVVSGRAGQAIWALALFGPALWRIVQRFRAARRFGSPPSPGAASEVETEGLAMSLDHESGRMTGRVKRGTYAGRDLAELDLAQLLDLLAELAANDAEGVPLLEAWLDRAHPEWREAASFAGPPPRGSGGRMTRAEALSVLGLAEGASEAEIRGAHRRLMRTAHPDQGGSDWLAARLNEARDTLLGT